MLRSPMMVRANRINARAHITPQRRRAIARRAGDILSPRAARAPRHVYDDDDDIMS